MRQLIFQALNAQADLQSLMPAPPGQDGSEIRLYQWGSLGTGDITPKPVFPFALLYEQRNESAKEFRDGKSVRLTFRIYVYDQHGEGYLRIQQVLRTMRDTLLGLIAQVSPSGARCTDVKWLGQSVDSRDPEYNANMKFGTVVFITRQ